MNGVPLKNMKSVLLTILETRRDEHTKVYGRYRDGAILAFNEAISIVTSMVPDEPPTALRLSIMSQGISGEST